jgi:hypothetical protein
LPDVNWVVRQSWFCENRTHVRTLDGPPDAVVGSSASLPIRHIRGFLPTMRRRPLARPGIAATAIALGLLAGPAGAQAQTFTVTNTSDSGVTGDGSLRGEVLAANVNPGPDVIDFAGGVTGTITLSGDGLQIKDPLDLEGPGPGQITVAQSSAKRVIHLNMNSPGPVTIAGLHVANGTAEGPGGNIWNDSEHPASSLTIVNSLITGGTASDYGGGISCFGASLVLHSTTLSGNHAIAGGGAWVGGGEEDHVAIAIENSTFSGNTASGFGGGLFVEIEDGSALISGTTFSGNQAKSSGGAAVTLSEGPVTIAASTFFGNTATAGGGGGLSLSSDDQPIAVRDSTISGNHSNGSTGKGGGIDAPPSHPARLENTIVAGNSADGGGADLAGPIEAAFSLVGNPSGATLTETVAGSDMISFDPQLGPLQNNGGPTETMAIPATSPAVNRGSSGLGADQRGQPRPVLYPGVPISAAPGANGADIGAYELQAPPLPSNAFRFGKVKLNKKKGTATVAIVVPGPGVVSLVGSKKVKKGSKTVKGAGTVKLLLKAKGKALRSLNRNGKVKLKAKFTFAPTGGTPASKTKTLKLVKKRP